MAFNSQRILKSKYLSYRYFEAMINQSGIHKNGSTPMLTYDEIVKDAIEKVNSLTGKSYVHPPSFPEHKSMYDGNVNIAINRLVEMNKPDELNLMPNFMMFSLKNNDKVPDVFVYTKQEMCMYIIAFLNKMMTKKKYSNVANIIDILKTSDIMNIANISKSDLSDEIAYAESQLSYVSGRNRVALIYQALSNCNRINIIIEYLVVNKRRELFRRLPIIHNRDGVSFVPTACTNEQKMYYIIPFTSSNSNKFDVTYF